MSEPKKMSPVFEGGGDPPKKRRSKQIWLPVVAIGGFGACVLMAVIGIATLGPFFREARQSRLRNACLNNVRTISRSSLIYATDNNDRLPLASDWPSGIATYTHRQVDGVIRCPIFPRGSEQYGIAMNAQLSGKGVSGLTNASETPLAFDSDELKRGASAAYESKPKHGRHRVRVRGSNVGFSDGAARFVPDSP